MRPATLVTNGMRTPTRPSFPLSKDRLDNFAGYIGQPEAPALIFESQALVVDSQQAQQRGVEVMDVHGIFHDVVAKLASLAKNRSRLDAPACHPNGETTRMMIPAVVGAGQFALRIIGAAELAAPNDQRVVEQAALFEISDRGPLPADLFRGTVWRSPWAGCRADPTLDDTAE